jgi:superfamily II DNA or RNA helicase
MRSNPVDWLLLLRTRLGPVSFLMRASPAGASPTTQAKRQALQAHILALVQGRRLAGVAVAMGVGKTLLGLRDMERVLAESHPLEATTTPFLVAAPTTAILDSWPQEARKFGLAHLLDHITFTTYRSLSKALNQGHYHKLYLDECHTLEEQAEHTYHAKNKDSYANLDLFNAGSIQRLTYVAQLSEGINIANLRVGIIRYAFGNERKTAQRIGRLLPPDLDQTATVHLLVYQDTVDEH